MGAIDYAKLLPITKGQRVSEYMKEFFREVSGSLRSVVATEDLPGMRQRNEVWASYAERLATIIMAARDIRAGIAASWKQENPKPKSGITEWNDALHAHTSDQRYIIDYATGLQSALETRISVSQSNIKSRTEELRYHGPG